MKHNSLLIVFASCCISTGLFLLQHGKSTGIATTEQEGLLHARTEFSRNQPHRQISRLGLSHPRGASAALAKEEQKSDGTEQVSSLANTAGSQVPSAGYLSRHAASLRQEADQLESTLARDLTESRQRLGSAATKARLPSRHPLHFFTYSTPAMNLTAERILLQAQRSRFFQSTAALGPADLPPEFAAEFRDILADPHGGGNYLWRYPIWELIMRRVPLYEYALFLDAGCTVFSTGLRMLEGWLEGLEESSERGVLFDTARSKTTAAANSLQRKLDSELADEVGRIVLGESSYDASNKRRELIRFPQEPKKNRELRWTTDAVFSAFGLAIEGEDAWGPATKPQLYGGLLLARNGAQWRNMTALIYETLAPDPYIITDKYSEATKRRRSGRFDSHRHDQSISSIAGKLLDNFVMTSLMGTWVQPPFGASRHRNISQAQLRAWSKECKDAPRHRDHFCDKLAGSIFEENTEVE